MRVLSHRSRSVTKRREDTRLSRRVKSTANRFEFA